MRKTPTYRVVSNPVGVEPGELTVLFAGESQTKPSHRVGPKVADYFLLHHVTSGRGRFRLGESETELGPGDTFLIPPNELASYVSDEADPWKYRWIAFAGTHAAALAASAGLGASRPVVRTGVSKIPGQRCKNIYESFWKRGPAAPLEAAGHLLLLFAALRELGEDGTPAPPRPESHAEELVRQVIGYLSSQYAEPVTIERMAETLGYNRAYLSRLFKAHAGVSPSAFLSRIRLDQGKRLLRERPELTVEQVAFSAGFQDALYFSKLFKRWHGQSPTEYRASVARTHRHGGN